MVSVRFTEQPSPRTPIIREVVVSRQGDGSRRPALKYGRSATTVPIVEGGLPRRVRFHLPGVTSGTNTATTAPSGHETRYRHGTLPSPLASTLADNELLLAARHSHETLLADLLRRAALHGAPPSEINQGDSSGRTVLSYIASNGSVLLLDLLLQVPGVDVNKPDNEGNAPLHFSAQAGQVETINYLLSRCSGIEIDARNNLGFTPLMKAAIQGRTKCAKLLIFAGASPIMRDTGRGLRAEQWARFCGRYVCADVIEKFARHRLLERSTSYGRWGSEPELGPHLINGRLQPPAGTMREQSSGIKSRLRRAFRPASNPTPGLEDTHQSFSLVTQLTTAGLCASTPVLPKPSSVPPVVKSLIRPLTVPKLQVTSCETPSSRNNTILTSPWPTVACPPSTTKLKKKK